MKKKKSLATIALLAVTTVAPLSAAMNGNGKTLGPSGATGQMAKADCSPGKTGQIADADADKSSCKAKPSCSGNSSCTTTTPENPKGASGSQKMQDKRNNDNN